MFRILVSSVSGSERAMEPTIPAVLECVRTSVSNQFPSLMPALFSGDLETKEDPQSSVNQLREAFAALETNKKLENREQNMFSLPSTPDTLPHAGGSSFCPLPTTADAPFVVLTTIHMAPPATPSSCSGLLPAWTLSQPNA